MMALGKMTLSMMALGKMTIDMTVRKSDTQKSDTQHNNKKRQLSAKQ
jgi:hypothetical protein